MEKFLPSLMLLYSVVVSTSWGQQMTSTESPVSVIDLSHHLGNDTIYWPGNPQPDFLFTIISRGRSEAGYWYEANKFETSEHGGTHVDSPSHFSETSWRTHEIPAHRMIGPGVVVNVTAQVVANPDYRVGVSDLQGWERDNGAIPNGAIVFMLSGWAVRYPNKSLTFNTNDPTNPATFRFPGYHPDAIDWLIENRNISMIGVDTPSNDYGQSKTYEVHQKLAAANIIGLENVNNLDQVPAKGSTIFVGVTKLYDGSGGPVRILALISNTGKPDCSCPSVGNGGISQAGHWNCFMLIATFVAVLSCKRTLLA